MIVQGQLVVRAVDYLSAPYGMMDPYEEIRKAADRSRQVHSTIGHLVQQAVVGSSRLGVENGENIVPQLCNWAAAQGKKSLQIFARSEERRVGQECASTCIFRGALDDKKKKKKIKL